MAKTDLIKLDASLPLGSLEAYIARVNQMPMLTVEEEMSLSKSFREEGNLDAAKRLVMSHLRVVVKIVRGYAGYGLPKSDLIQEGNIGLMKAVKRFDPTLGVRLVSFAIHWIRAEIHEFIVRNWRIVKIATTKAQRKLFFNLRKSAKRLGWFSSEEVSVIAKHLNVSEKDVLLMESRLKSSDQTFDAPAAEGDEVFPAHYLEDNRYNPSHQLESENWTESREKHLQSALTRLDERSQDILYQRWLSEQKATLHDLASKYGVSAERIRQLEQSAMQKLKMVLA